MGLIRVKASHTANPAVSVCQVRRLRLSQFIPSYVAPAPDWPASSRCEQRGGIAGMPSVWSCNEWDQLEEVIVGSPLHARFPTPDRSTQVAEYPDRSLAKIPRGPFPQKIIEETEEDLNGFCEILESFGVKVRRPETWPHEAKFSTINWESHGYYNYCPRDVMMVVGDQIIETPNVIRSRS